MTAVTVPCINRGRRWDHTAPLTPGLRLGKPVLPESPGPTAGAGRAVPALISRQAPSPPAPGSPGFLWSCQECKVPGELGWEHHALSLPRIIPLPGKPGL